MAIFTSGIFTRVDRYVLSVISTPMRNIFIFVVVILECVRFRLGLGLAIHQDKFFALIFTYMGQWLALYSGLALQMALAVGMMLGIARLAQNRELDALHALGYSLHRLMRPVVVMAVLVVICDFFILGWLQPISLYNSGAFVHQVQKFVSLLPEGGDLFVTSNNKTVLIDNITPKSNSFGKIFVFETYPDGKTIATGGAKGHLVIVPDDPKQYYDVSDVRMLQVVIGKDAIGRVLPDAYNASASSQAKGPVEAIDTSNFRKRGNSEWEMTFPELASMRSPVPEFAPYIKKSAIVAEFNYRIVQLLYILVIPFIAVLFVVEPRRNPGPFRFLLGLLTILGFHQFLGLGTEMARKGEVPVWLTVWVPFLVLTAYVFWRFRALSLKPGFNTAR
ncbi:LptF/LptG family permease [Aestuariivirga litoralis]|uniref:LptF/LptG family permease n=1 Tax=Aestuariivirga litoralis TaxID=2650924 RepID=UPI0018C83A5B|nr:LptF/LptG family permease [Aestuariivirga litoralis]MBG1233924.1 YjgP/YjgQ family permease [Aestuariivirga litoralis]